MQQPRFTGPYHEPGRPQPWRVVVWDAEGGRSSLKAGSEEEARELAEAAIRKLNNEAPLTIGKALENYEVHLRDAKGGKPRAIATTLTRLRSFFTALVPREEQGAELDRPLTALTPARAQQIYVAVSGRPCAGLRCAGVVPLGTATCPRCGGGEFGTPRWAADTHRNVLAEARTFFRWALEHKHLQRDPLAAVKGVGKRNHGKKQLRVDDAREWLAVAFRLADEGDEGAVGALLTLACGLSGEEITGRVVRDLDDRGRLLQITEGKTEARRVAVRVPEDLRPYLQRAACGKLPGAPLFTSERTGGHHWRDWPREQVAKICKRAGVPVVTAHGMRGLRGTLEVLAGRGMEGAATTLRHENSSVTERSYVDREVAEEMKTGRVFRILKGG